MLRLNNGQRMLIPKEMLGELKNATLEQAHNVEIKLLGLSVWWPQLDDGLYLPDFLEHRWVRSFAEWRRRHPPNPTHTPSARAWMGHPKWA